MAGRRWYMGTILVGISLLWSYYFLYINTIALVVYFLVRFFCKEKTQRTVRRFIQYVLRFAGTYLLGVGIGFLGIMTSLSSYAGSSRTVSGGLDTISGGNYGASWPIILFQPLHGSRWLFCSFAGRKEKRNASGPFFVSWPAVFLLQGMSGTDFPMSATGGVMFWRF